jgi:peptidoglycan/xylan/chitin deacetylase (PgdA/CDA1 family)
MVMYTVRTPALVKPLMKELTWSIPTADRVLHLTFDDGPIPEVTPWVLDELDRCDAKATFFCIGRNAEANPGILDRIVRAGHRLGNHTWDHANGWRTPLRAYLRNVLQCQTLTRSDLFRPPYGRITMDQVRALRKRYRIVMWDVLSGDFDGRIDGERCYRNVVDHAGPGSIIVFHDSLKAEPRLRRALPRVLHHFRERGYTFRALPPITA